MTERDSRLRFEVPLYTITEAARIVDVPVSTLTNWAQGYVRRFQDRPKVVGDPIVTYLEPEGPRRPSIPFVGLTEATVLAAVRRSGVFCDINNPDQVPRIALFSRGSHRVRSGRLNMSVIAPHCGGREGLVEQFANPQPRVVFKERFPLAHQFAESRV